MEILYFIGAILAICIAHLIRIVRWELFIKIYEKPNHRNLIQSLSVGYLLNYVLPFKMGDVVRAWMSGKKMQNGKALGLSTVIVDRYFDIVAVGIIFIFLSFARISEDTTLKTSIFYVAASIILLVILLIIYIFRGLIKKSIRAFARLFNDSLETSILRFAWALIWNFKDIFLKINKTKMIITTVGMWIFYLISYYFIAAFLTACGVGTKWSDIFMILFASNGIKESMGTTLFNGYISFYLGYMIAYMLVPLLLMLMFSLLFKNNPTEEEKKHLNLLPHLDSHEKLAFLESYFGNKNKTYISNYLKINQGISIIRDYSAGSNATTMLCMDGEKTFFRKYAFGQDGEKLYQQILWIEENKNRLVLPTIFMQEKTDIYCYYDMPYSSNTVGLFEYVHTMPIEQGWNLIKRALESLEKSIYTINVRKADTETIHNYIELKVNKNIKTIKNSKRIKPLLQYKTIFINGVEYKNFTFYKKYLSEPYLQKVFKKDSYAVIHGDLTIENIICTRDEYGNDNFYIIDPNTGNVHDSPNLDYGKLLQSIHGGYEFLMSTREVKVTENHIDFLFTKSATYTKLHELLKDYMQETFGYERTRSIYFHEIIHWLRLMPYKIEKDRQRALLFYAGMLIVMNDVIKMFEND